MKTEESQALAVTTPIELLKIAVTQNLDVEKLEKLMQLQRQWEQDQARKAFVEAMNAFKNDPPVILKNKHVHFDTSKGPNDYDHATLDHVCDQVTKGLSKHGISHRWTVKQEIKPEGAWITVTCVLTHEQGHSEETTLMGTPDQTGSKNSIQAIGSTVTYLQRYTLLAATGLAARNTDDDGHASGAQVAEERVVECLDWLNNAVDMAELQSSFKTAYKEASEAKDKSAMEAYIEAKDRRKKELQNANR